MADTQPTLEILMAELKRLQDQVNSNSAQKFPGDGVAAQPVEEKPILGGSIGYPFTQELKDEWNRVDASLDASTAIAVAWARYTDKGATIGSPVSAEYTRKDGTSRQDFQYARASFDNFEGSNPNKIVQFFDARGIVGHETGM